MKFTDEEKELVASGRTDARRRLRWRRSDWAQLRGTWRHRSMRRIRCRAFWRRASACSTWRRLRQAWRRQAGAWSRRTTAGCWFGFLRSGKGSTSSGGSGGRGTEGDYACAQVIERESGIAMRGTAWAFSSAGVGGELVELAKRYNNALMAVERNNHGHGVLAHLKR